MCVGMEMRRLVCHLKMLKDAYSVLGKGLHNELTSRLDWYANLRFVCRWKRRRQTLSGEFCFFLSASYPKEQSTLARSFYAVRAACSVISIAFDELTL